jgi:hypothetical protein
VHDTNANHDWWVTNQETKLNIYAKNKSKKNCWDISEGN